MTFAWKQSALVLTLAGLGMGSAHAQYSTSVGTGAAKQKTLRATAVLEWTGSLTKPSASRLMPLAIWDGEHYQPASLYLAKPEPLAFAPGTQYVLERAGDEAGLFEVRTAAQLNGQWIGMGKVAPPPPPPPVKKLKPSKQLPVLAGGKSTDKGSPDTERPTLPGKAGDSAGKAPGAGAGKAPGAGAGKTPGASAGSTGASGKSGETADPVPAPPGDAKTSPPAAAQAPAEGTAGAGSPPTLHRRSDASSSDSPGDVDSTESDAKAAAGAKPSEPKPSERDPDRPTLHKRDDSSGSGSTPAGSADADPDRPTLHHGRNAAAAAQSPMDPDRPHLRYGTPADEQEATGPAKLEGAPPAMQQIVAVSDAGPAETQGYLYRWTAPADAAAMQAALATLAAQAAAKAVAPRAGLPMQTSFGPAAAAAARARTRSSTRSRSGTRSTDPHPAPAAQLTMAEEHFAAFELSFSGGATLVYSAHTDADGPQRVYVTLVAQPDFYGKPQVLFQQVSRGDRLAETPAMQLIDAVDTDGDHRAELVFSLLGGVSATTADVAAAGTGATATYSSTRAGVERQFAIYRVADRRVDQVFTSGPLP